MCLVNLSKGAAFLNFSRSVVSDSLRPHESQHTRPPCPSPTPVVYSSSSSCPSSWWCHPTISSSVVPFSCPQPLPASGSTRHQKQSTENGAAPLPAKIALPTFFQLSRQSPNQLACFYPFHLQPVLHTEARGILFAWKSWYDAQQRPCILFSLLPVFDSHSHSHRHQSSKVISLVQAPGTQRVLHEVLEWMTSRQDAWKVEK